MYLYHTAMQETGDVKRYNTADDDNFSQVQNTYSTCIYIYVHVHVHNNYAVCVKK